MTKTKSIPNPFARKILVATKVNPDEMREILARAQKFFGGNVSAWVREAVLKYKPKAGK